MLKVIQSKTSICQVKVRQFNGKLNSNQVSLLNYSSISSGSKDMVDFVFELEFLFLELQSKIYAKFQMIQKK